MSSYSTVKGSVSFEQKNFSGQTFPGRPTLAIRSEIAGWVLDSVKFAMKHPPSTSVPRVLPLSKKLRLCKSQKKLVTFDTERLWIVPLISHSVFFPGCSCCLACFKKHKGTLLWCWFNLLLLHCQIFFYSLFQKT